MNNGKLVEILNKHGMCVCKVGPTVTSIGASQKAGFPVNKAIRAGRYVWVQIGDGHGLEARNHNFGTAGPTNGSSK
jgi:hypothetical protein